MRTTETKIALLRDWLLKGHKVTPRDAIERWDYYRLSSGIHRLRHREGMDIATDNVTDPHTGAVHAEYYLNF